MNNAYCVYCISVNKGKYFIVRMQIFLISYYVKKTICRFFLFFNK